VVACVYPPAMVPVDPVPAEPELDEPDPPAPLTGRVEVPFADEL